MKVRLNKFISDSGHCSRREADKYIENGNVTINGKVAKIGAQAKRGDRVMVNGIEIEGRAEDVYIMLNKPIGVTCTTDPSDPTNIVNFVNYPSRVFNIGRLDKDSEGLILLTNNGDIVNKILRAGNAHEKEYEVHVNKVITPLFIEKMQNGIPILGTTTKRCKVVKEGEKSFRITLTQGLNRQIRRMCEYLHYDVVKLKRVRMMHLNLEKLISGNWRFLTEEETRLLLVKVDRSDNSEQASKGAGAGKKTVAGASRSSSERGGSNASKRGATSSGGGAKRGSSRRPTNATESRNGKKTVSQARRSGGDKRHSSPPGGGRNANKGGRR